MEDDGEVVEPLHLDFEDREVYLAKIPVRAHDDFDYERVAITIGLAQYCAL